MNFVTTRHSSNEFGSALAAPKFSDVRFYEDKKTRRLFCLIIFMNMATFKPY